MTHPSPTRFGVLAKPWFTGVALLLFIAGNAVILPQVTAFEALSGGVAMLEVPTQLGQDLREVVRAYPPEAVAHYRTVLLPIDVVYPATAGLFFTSALAVLVAVGRARRADDRLVPARE